LEAARAHLADEALSDEALVKQLVPALYAQDWKLRLALVEALAEVGDERLALLVPFLQGYVVDEHPRVRVAAIELLAKRRPEQTEGLRAILEYSVHPEIAAAARVKD
jgi:HEAT repeat protein